MAHLYRVTTWQSGSGLWYCNDTSDLVGVSAKWWVPARILNLSLTDYVMLLKDKFNATIARYNKEKDVLIFYWENEQDCNKYKNYINSQARKVNAMV